MISISENNLSWHEISICVLAVWLFILGTTHSLTPLFSFSKVLIEISRDPIVSRFPLQTLSRWHMVQGNVINYHLTQTQVLCFHASLTLRPGPNHSTTCHNPPSESGTGHEYNQREEDDLCWLPLTRPALVQSNEIPHFSKVDRWMEN